VLYSIAAWYFQKIVPKEHGLQEPWHFPLHLSFWSPCLPASATRMRETYTCGPIVTTAVARLNEFYQRCCAMIRTTYGAPSKSSATGSKCACIEPVVPELHAQEASGSCLAMRGLSKSFVSASTGQTVHAVRGLDLTLYKGHISCILGE
jgi:ABC-type glutathione transport system ATPase component